MFVGGVKSETTDEAIMQYFETFGAVESVDRPINKQTNENKPFCFVTFKKDGVAAKCIKRTYNILKTYPMCFLFNPVCI